MTLHNCEHTFAELSESVLPRYMQQLRKRMGEPLQMARFSNDGAEAKPPLVEFDPSRVFSGCYVLLDGGTPIYVGISRNVFGRLRQHVRGKTHYDASLAYRIAKKRDPRAMRRNEAMADEAFRVHFAKSQEYLRSIDVAYVEIVNPLELYLFEPFCAMELDTYEWNKFETH